MRSKKAVLFALGLMLALPLAAGPGGEVPALPTPQAAEAPEVPNTAPLPVDPLFDAVPLACVPYGNVCDPRYVPGAVCCPGTHCYSPYPGVPQFCL